jgi:hypothetical protein
VPLRRYAGHHAFIPQDHAAAAELHRRLAPVFAYKGQNQLKGQLGFTHPVFFG